MNINNSSDQDVREKALMASIVWFVCGAGGFLVSLRECLLLGLTPESLPWLLMLLVSIPFVIVGYLVFRAKQTPKWLALITCAFALPLFPIGTYSSLIMRRWFNSTQEM